MNPEIEFERKFERKLILSVLAAALI